MRKTWKNLALGTFMLGGIATLAACSDSDSNGAPDKARLQISLTDDPGDYAEVWIDVKEIRFNGSDADDQNWVVLPGVKAGAYNLLDLVNDKDTMLVDAEIPTGKISQIRLVLGDNNFLITNEGERIALTTPSAQQSGLKLNIHQPVVAGIINKLTLDFDVAKSIVKAGNSGKYILKPVIRTVLEAVGGNIRGGVLPDSVQAAVLAIVGTDTVASTYSLNGGYLLRGIPAGAYNLHFLPTDTNFLPAVKLGVPVVLGQVTTVDTVKLMHK
ncbi:DUF4382 domain-containing protein [Chitinophaga deserti]|uniref:DUF4382 domain-containing protein n=1 Tax=Chitinophaga deserti TaxID=2164099 RepID=UPI001E40408F|nr:DUF4382 domain-containing protein [Chitinophaga deserti]